MIKRGVNRTVILVGSYAIKFPSFRNGATYFVYGMLANLLENYLWKLSESKYLAPVHLTGPLGLFSINKRYSYLLTRLLTPEEVRQLPFINFDNNGRNVAIDKGQIVLIDYGNTDMYFVEDDASKGLALGLDVSISDLLDHTNQIMTEFQEAFCES